jgi:hypothetical protein
VPAFVARPGPVPYPELQSAQLTAMVCSKSLILRKLGGDTVADTAPKQESRPERRPSEKPHKRLVWLRGQATTDTDIL